MGPLRRDKPEREGKRGDKPCYFWWFLPLWRPSRLRPIPSTTSTHTTLPISLLSNTIPRLKPTLYNAEPEPFIGIWNQLPKGSGKYLPGVFGWDRGEDYFMKWNDVPVQLRNNRVRWRTDGQMMRNGFNSASGADPNKKTDKYSYPGSYQG